jgi:hypothetical protein
MLAPGREEGAVVVEAYEDYALTTSTVSSLPGEQGNTE